MAGTVEDTGERLEARARELYLTVDYTGSIEAHEQAYAAYRHEGDALGAARVARMLSWLNGNIFGDWAVARGWLERSCRFLDDAGGDGPERGWVEALRAMAELDYGKRAERFKVALDIARRFRDPDLETEALAWLGLGLVLTDHVEEGMRLLDEALAAVCGGEVQDLYVIEGIFCGMFTACERAHDVARAEQWLRAADDIVRRRNQVAVGAFCRAHYGGILTAAGRWSEAEAELREAARIFEGGYVAVRRSVLVRLADLRLRQGRLEEAAQLLEGLDQHPDAARPLAALHFARGETALARDVLDRALALVDVPPAARAGPLLALSVDVHLAEGAVDAATQDAQRLEEIAARHPGDYLRACAAVAKGKVCIASGSGDPQRCLQHALAAFSRAQMPAEAARARLELARAVAQDRPEVAIAEAKAALEVFEQLDAARDADAAGALLRALGAPVRVGRKGLPALTKREAEVLELLGYGLSNPQIAARLYITPKTAEHHVRHILAKLGLRNRAEAAAYAARAADKIRQ